MVLYRLTSISTTTKKDGRQQTHHGKKENTHTNMSHGRLLDDVVFVFHSSVMAVFFVGRQIGLVGFSVSLLRFGPSELPRLN